MLIVTFIFDKCISLSQLILKSGFMAAERWQNSLSYLSIEIRGAIGIGDVGQPNNLVTLVCMRSSVEVL